MPDLKLNFACGLYDRMLALYTGDVSPEGIDLQFQVEDSPRVIFDRMAGELAFDMAEFSASEYISQRGRGDCPFVALPVFPSKLFRHGFICINTTKGINAPADLAGKRIGVPLYTMTAAVFNRGFMQHDCGIDLDTIQWVQGSVNYTGSHGNPSAPPLLKDINIEVNETGKPLSQLLAEGEIDATIGSTIPDSLGAHPDVARLFPDYRAAERDYYQRTKIHPIMHVLAIKRDIYEANPWIAQPLYEAFTKSKDLALEKLRYSGSSRYMLPFLRADLDEIDEVFDGDPWPYGIEANRPTLEALVTYMVDQGLIADPIPLDELFISING